MSWLSLLTALGKGATKAGEVATKLPEPIGTLGNIATGRGSLLQNVLNLAGIQLKTPQTDYGTTGSEGLGRLLKMIGLYGGEYKPRSPDWPTMPR